MWPWMREFDRTVLEAGEERGEEGEEAEAGSGDLLLVVDVVEVEGGVFVGPATCHPPPPPPP